MNAFALHFADIYAASRKRERQTGVSTSESRIDSMAAVRLRATGHSKDDVRDAIQLLAPSLRHELDLDPNAHEWNDYAKRTADYAFGKGGERDLAKFTVKMIDRYWQMEHPEHRDVAAKKRPLSLQDDKDRLKELTSLRDAYAANHAAPIMDDAKQSALDQAAERVMLTELIELSTRMKGYISNPVSQPNGHKIDAARVERIFEIEASRGLTHDEAHTKHPGVQKYYATVGKYLKKQMGKDVTRGFER